MENNEILIHTQTASLKNGEKINLKLFISDMDYHRIDALTNENTLVGTTYFNLRGEKCWLNKISVENSDYHLLGVGTAMINYLEKYCESKRCIFIEGKFYPEGEGAENAELFYKNRGYKIIRDDYKTYIEKMLNPNKYFHVTL